MSPLEWGIGLGAGLVLVIAYETMFRAAGRVYEAEVRRRAERSACLFALCWSAGFTGLTLVVAHGNWATCAFGVQTVYAIIKLIRDWWSSDRKKLIAKLAGYKAKARQAALRVFAPRAVGSPA